MVHTVGVALPGLGAQQRSVYLHIYIYMFYCVCMLYVYVWRVALLWLWLMAMVGYCNTIGYVPWWSLLECTNAPASSGQAVGCGISARHAGALAVSLRDTPELWRGAAGSMQHVQLQLCNVHTRTHTHPANTHTHQTSTQHTHEKNRPSLFPFSVITFDPVQNFNT